MEPPFDTTRSSNAGYEGPGRLRPQPLHDAPRATWTEACSAQVKPPEQVPKAQSSCSGLFHVLQQCDRRLSWVNRVSPLEDLLRRRQRREVSVLQAIRNGSTLRSVTIHLCEGIPYVQPSAYIRLGSILACARTGRLPACSWNRAGLRSGRRCCDRRGRRWSGWSGCGRSCRCHSRWRPDR
jgi:hypothetical protein